MSRENVQFTSWLQEKNLHSKYFVNYLINWVNNFNLISWIASFLKIILLSLKREYSSVTEHITRREHLEKKLSSKRIFICLFASYMNDCRYLRINCWLWSSSLEGGLQTTLLRNRPCSSQPWQNEKGKQVVTEGAELYDCMKSNADF